MKYNSNIHHRRSIRLRGYDYSQSGAYLVTICAQNRACLFGGIVDGKMALNEYGKIVADEWVKTAMIRREIELDEWIVMPNHFHGIVVICAGDRPQCTGDRPVAPTGPRPRSLGSLMAGFKSAVTKQINAIRRAPGTKLWQRNYWEHIVRNENELNRIRQYIIDNPVKWEHDREHPHIMPKTQTVREPSQSYGEEPWMI